MDGVVALDAEAVPELTALAAFALSTVMSFSRDLERALRRSFGSFFASTTQNHHINADGNDDTGDREEGDDPFSGEEGNEDEEPKSKNSEGAEGKINSAALRAWRTQSLTGDDTNDYDRYDQCDADPHVLHATLY